MGDVPLAASRAYPITADGVAESNEDITLAVPTLTTFGAAATYTTTSTAIAITIRANDSDNRYTPPEPTFTVSVDDADTAEGDTAVFTVTLGGTAPASGAVSVDWAVSGGASASDYTVSGADTDGTLSFTALSSQTLNFAITADGLREDAEMLTVTLSNPSSGSVIGTASATTTIAESDQPHAHSFAFTNPAATITEGAAATTYTVTRTGPAITSGTTLTVTWAYAAGTPAPAAADFHNDTLPAGGELEFTGSETSETFTVRTKEDTLNEAGERFTLTLSIASAHQAAATAAGRAGVPAAHTVTITDDDPVTVAITRASGSGAVGEGSGALSFTVTVAGGTRASGVDTIVPFSVSGLTAGEFDITAPTGIAASATGGSITIAHGSNTGTITLTLQDDDLNEAQETLTITGGAVGASGLRLSGSGAGAVAYTSGGNTASVMVTDDDAITVSIAAPNPATQDEGSTIEFPVSFAGATSGSAAAIDVAYTVAWVDTTFTDGMFTDLDGGSITIPAGDTGGNIRVRVQHSIPLDSTSADEMLRVTLGAITVGSGGGSATGSGMADATVNWVEIDAAHLIEVADATVDEGAASITVTRSASMDLVQPVDIMWAVTHGTTAAADFNGPLTGSVRFAGNQETATIRLNIVNDNLAEMAETFTLTLSENLDATVQTANSVVVADDTATVTITDNDNIRITIGGPGRISEERAAAFTVTLSATPTANLSVMWTVAAATGGTLAADCSAPSNIVAADAGDFADADGAMLSSYPGSTLTFTADSSAAQTIPLRTSAGTRDNSASGATASAAGNGYDQTCDRQFTITVSTTDNGGGSAVPMDATVTITISEDNPEAIAELNESVLPEVARAVATNQVAAIAERVGTAGGVAGGVPQFNLNGQSTLAGGTAANLRDWAKGGGLDTEELLRDMDFVMPLNAAGGLLGENRMALWGGTDYRDFKGEDGSSKWDGDMFSLHLGADARVNERLLAGVMISYSEAGSEYQYDDNGRLVRGDYDLEMTGFSPYVSWDLPGGSAWFSLGYGQGDLTIDPDEAGRDTMESDVAMTSFSIGGARLLRASNAHELRLKGDAFMASIDVDGDDDNENLGAIDVDASRLRVLVESRHKFTLASGAQFTPLVDMGARHDGGDGSTGGGIEVGGGVHYAAPGVGLTAQARARVLLGRGNQDEWGIGGVVRLSPGADGQGLSLKLTPSYGDANADVQGIWDNGVAGVGASAKSAASDADMQATIAAEVGWGMQMPAHAFGRRDSGGVFGNGGGLFSSGGLLTPYTALRLGDKNDYRMGLRWSANKRLNLDLSARHLDTDNRLTLEGKLKL